MKGSVRWADRGRDLCAGFLARITSGPVSSESLPYLNHADALCLGHLAIGRCRDGGAVLPQPGANRTKPPNIRFAAPSPSQTHTSGVGALTLLARSEALGSVAVG